MGTLARSKHALGVIVYSRMGPYSRVLEKRGHGSHGLIRTIQTNKQTNKQYYPPYIGYIVVLRDDDELRDRYPKNISVYCSIVYSSLLRTGPI